MRGRESRTVLRVHASQPAAAEPLSLRHEPLPTSDITPFTTYSFQRPSCFRCTQREQGGQRDRQGSYSHQPLADPWIAPLFWAGSCRYRYKHNQNTFANNVEAKPKCCGSLYCAGWHWRCEARSRATRSKQSPAGEPGPQWMQVRRLNFVILEIVPITHIANTPTFFAGVETRHEITCCADEPVSGWRSCAGGTVWAERNGALFLDAKVNLGYGDRTTTFQGVGDTQVGGGAFYWEGDAQSSAFEGCVHNAPFEVAADICHSIVVNAATNARARLCTAAETLEPNICGKGTGCYHDSDRVWYFSFPSFGGALNFELTIYVCTGRTLEDPTSRRPAHAICQHSRQRLIRVFLQRLLPLHRQHQFPTATRSRRSRVEEM